MIILLCNSEAHAIDLKFNHMKTICMVFRSDINKAVTDNMQHFRINNNNIEF